MEASLLHLVAFRANDSDALISEERGSVVVFGTARSERALPTLVIAKGDVTSGHLALLAFPGGESETYDGPRPLVAVSCVVTVASFRHPDSN